MTGSFEFLEPSGAAVARSPMEGQALAAGARMEVRDGWNVAVDYPGARARRPGGWADLSHLRKLEVMDPTSWPSARPRGSTGPGGARSRASGTLVIGAAEVDALEVTTTLAALAIVGPQARELFARFCALDLRAQSMPVGGFRPGRWRAPPAMSCARTPIAS